MATTQTEYERGSDAARQALDHSTLAASELLAVARSMEQFYRARDMVSLAERFKGFADHVQEFLDDKAR